MKCKNCGIELFAGTKKCPYCGEEIQQDKRNPADVFNWNVSGFPQPNRKKDVSIDWSAGKIFNKSSGQVYDQEEKMWSEPEAVKDLFVFDKKNEEYQEILDRQVEKIVDERKSRPDASLSGMSRIFDLPSSIDMADFSDLIDDNVEINTVNEAGEEVYIEGLERWTGRKNKKEPDTSEGNATFDWNIDNVSENRKSKQDSAAAVKDAAESEASYEVSGGSIGNEENEDIYSVPSDEPVPGFSVLSEYKSSETADERPAFIYSRNDETFVNESLRKLMDSEERFKDVHEKVVYITEDESEKAEKAEKRSQKLKSASTVSFRSIEDEYAAYCDENGIEKAPPIRYEPKSEKRAEEKLPSRREKESILSGARKAGHSITSGIGNALAGQTLNQNKNKEVEIKINEASGTKVTVKTQEINLASRENSDNTQTREVNLEEVRNSGPKNVQVSVEVNAAQGNASVEVTRRHDGATVVKTIDQSPQEASAEECDASAASVVSAGAGIPETYAVDNADAGAADEASTSAEMSASLGAEVTEEPEAEGYSSEENINEEAEGEAGNSFWERSDNATRMTITDIFGPEARKILEQLDKANGIESAEQAEGASDKASKKKDDLSNSLILDISPEDIAITKDQTMALRTQSIETAPIEDAEKTIRIENIREIPELRDSEEVQEETAEDKPEEKIPAGEGASEGDAVSEEAQDIDESDVSETEAADDVSENISEKESNESETEVSDNNINDSAADNTESSDAENDAEKDSNEGEAEVQAKEEISDTPKKSGMSGVTKIVIAVLAILLAAEFSVIGIKLYAPDSQAAVFIEKVEEQVSGVLKGDGGQSAEDASQQTSEGDINAGAEGDNVPADAGAQQ